jgi:AcrR family transcriptional regulator
VPKLWDETIETHRHAVRDATLDATEALVTESGLTAVTMSRIAERTGIGRATLYRYFPDVESVLAEWHERHVSTHLEQLAEIRAGSGDPSQRLAAVLGQYASNLYEQRGSEIAALLHRGEHVARARHRLHGFIRDLISEGADAGTLRDDVAPDELASYCLHALTAAASLRSKAAMRRLVLVTVDGLRRTAR